jgi:hypothetical protein
MMITMMMLVLDIDRCHLIKHACLCLLGESLPSRSGNATRLAQALAHFLRLAIVNSEIVRLQHCPTRVMSFWARRTWCDRVVYLVRT